MSFFTTPPISIIDYPADTRHFMAGRRGFTPRYIAVHHTGGINSLKWLTITSDPVVSAHRLISRAGTNFKLVKDEDTAFCAGYGIVGPTDPDNNDPRGVAPNFNVESLNMELENKGNGEPYPLVQMDMAARQIVEWFGLWGQLALVGHSWVDARKNDPFGFDWRLLYRLITQHLRAVLT